MTATQLPAPRSSRVSVCDLTLLAAVVAAVGRLAAARWPRRPRRADGCGVIVISVP